MTNPLLQEWDTPFGIPPFPVISDGDFAPALEQALAAHRAEIAAIAGDPAAPDFANTVEALEASGRTLTRVMSVFFTLAGADSNPEREALQREFSPKLAAHFADITANKALFARLADLWARRDDLGLNPEQARLLMLTHRDFVRAGAALEGAQAGRMKEIKGRLAELGTGFAQNLLADERDWSMPLDAAALAALPDFVADAAHQAGEERGADGPVVTLSRSIIVPFLQFSPRRDLRETAWRAWAARGAGGGTTDNRKIAAETLSLRAEMAALLGYDSYAAYRLETEMAGTPERVRELLMAVWEPAAARAASDSAVLEEMLQADGANGPLEPWDWRFYAEKRRADEHELNEAALKPYLQLDRILEAAFDCANRLFGLEFRPLETTLYHPDCRAWEVTRDGARIAVFIGDYFARASKRSGAWCSALRAQSKFPETQTPVVINVCNFAPGDPALLSWDDARTVFHEFGHALHQMLSDVTYESISGTSVARDFVELPSQLFEHWLEVPEVLRKFARHAETGAPMPSDMLGRLLAAAKFDMGFQTVEYVASALVDLDFHDGPAPADPMVQQAGTLRTIGMPRAIGPRHGVPHFAHVVSGGGYASAYYSYMWSEVMDADAFEAFEEHGGPFDPDIAAALERNILSSGGSAEPAELYRAFRGRLPAIGALLKGRGLADDQGAGTGHGPV